MTKEYHHKNIDILLHSRVRLAIVALLSSVDELNFNDLLNEIDTSKGNLSTHLKKLEDEKYISVKKSFIKRKPNTSYSITTEGLTAFQNYLDLVESFALKKKM